MKKFNVFIFIFALFAALLCFIPPENAVFAEDKPALLTIVIDDAGGWDQSGFETMISIDAPLTIAVMPLTDNTKLNANQARESGKEVIVHMPMEAHVNLPFSWYGQIRINNTDSKEAVYEKLDAAFKDVGEAAGFNVHIGSGVCQAPEVAGYIYDWAKEHKMPFLDSRTHINTLFDRVAKEKGEVYLGRTEFLEPDGNKSYEGVKRHLMIAAQKAKETGHAIAIGHVGSHGGENTARAIKDSIEDIKAMGVEIVPLSVMYESLK